LVEETFYIWSAEVFASAHWENKKFGCHEVENLVKFWHVSENSPLLPSWEGLGMGRGVGVGTFRRMVIGQDG